MEKIDINQVAEAYKNSMRRLFILDYEGTLISSAGTSPPSVMEGVNELLFSLTGTPANRVVVISNQTKDHLAELFNYLPLTLAAENGGFFRILRDQWQAMNNGSLVWKNPVLHALSILAMRYKGSAVEQKHFSLIWNYDSVRTWIPPEELQQFQAALRSLAKKYGLRLHESDHSIEFTVPEVNKGKFAANWVGTHGEFDFILAIGDDSTDEDLFEAVGRDYYTIRVGLSSNSAARYYLDDQSYVIPFLKGLINRSVL